MIKNYECKLGARRPHLVRTPVELPCASLACLMCVIECRDYFWELECAFCGRVHRIADDTLFKNSMFLERYLLLNTREIASDINTKFKKSLFHFKGKLILYNRIKRTKKIQIIKGPYSICMEKNIPPLHQTFQKYLYIILKLRNSRF